MYSCFDAWKVKCVRYIIPFESYVPQIFLLEGSVLCCSGPEESKAKVLHCNIMETEKDQ